MFPINPRKIKERFKDFFSHDKRIEAKIRLKTETIQRETEMHSMLSGKKHKIVFRFNVTGIVREDGSFQFGTGSENLDLKSTSADDIDMYRYPEEPVFQAIDDVSDEIRKNLKISDDRKSEWQKLKDKAKEE